MRSFVVDSILAKEDICNLEADSQFLFESMIRGDHIVFFGRRNMGKTSLVLSKVIPEYKASIKNALVVVADFLGVQSEAEVLSRVKSALEDALVETFPTQAKLKKIASTILSLRPIIQLDGQTGELQLSLDAKLKGQATLTALFSEMKNLAKANPILLVFDEFQDIVNIKGMDAKMRTELQKLPAKSPTLVMGSKKHLLSQLFSLPQAPLAGWGVDYEISSISPTEFLPYLNERFKIFHKNIGIEETKYLCDLMENIPEAILYVCMTLCRSPSHSVISKDDIDAAIERTVDLRRGRYEESLEVFTRSERLFMTEVARLQPVKSPTGKEFIQAAQLSSAGILKITRKLEDLGLIYRSKEGLSLSDPLLATYIRNHW